MSEFLVNSKKGFNKPSSERCIMCTNLVWQEGKVNYEERCNSLKQKGLVVWFTGLSGSGKSTIAIELEKRLFSIGKLVYRLDGDNLRSGLNSDLSFSVDDRNENIRRIIEVAILLKDAAFITLVSVISPYENMRTFARERIGTDDFIEIYVKASIEECIKRDTKGFYKKAQSGDIENYTGISEPYEVPQKPDLILDTMNFSIEDCVNKCLKQILQY